MSLDVHDMVQRADMEDTECILCGNCVDGCPRKVIRYIFPFRTATALAATCLEACLRFHWGYSFIIKGFDGAIQTDLS